MKVQRTIAVETLESRLALSVAAVDDLYLLREGEYLHTDTTLLVPAWANWESFQAITRTGPNANYPANADSLASWRDRDYDTAAPTFGSWRASAPAPFRLGTIDGLGAATPTTALSLSNDQPTALFRTTFSLEEVPAAPARFIIAAMCDDGCAGYINGVEVFRFELTGNPIQAAQYASANINGGAESEYRYFDVDITGRGVPLFADDENVLAVEVHQSGANSGDMVFDAVLYADAGGGVRRNDIVQNASPEIRTYFHSPGDDPALTTRGTGPVYDAATGTIHVGNVTLHSKVGRLDYSPIEREFGGDATFQYVLRDELAQTRDIGTVTLRIAPENDAPVAANDVFYHAAGRGSLIAADGPKTVLSDAGAFWSYNDDNTNQDELNPTWNDGPEAGFSPGPAAWKYGVGPLGYGEQNLQLMTILAVGPQYAPDGHITYYFYREFDAPSDVFESDAESLLIELLHDDCAAVYVNGVSVLRTPLLPADSTWRSTCLGFQPRELEYVEFRVDATEVNLRPTGNTLAVELHNNLPNAEDGFFDMRLSLAPHGLLANDFDADDAREALTVEVVDQSQFTPAIGSLEVRDDGSFTFTPASENVAGEFSFTYRVVDSGGPTGTVMSSAIATATIYVSACVCDADLNDDGAVDRGDLALLVANFGRREFGELAGDLDGDGRVAPRDAILLRDRLPQEAAQSPAAVMARAGARTADAVLMAADHDMRAMRVRRARRAASVRPEPTATADARVETAWASTASSATTISRLARRSPWP